LFVPGHELLNADESRATGVLARILSLTEPQVAETVTALLERYAHRHRDFRTVLHQHFAQIAHRVPQVAALSEGRQTLVGACFTHEFALEGAALFNPSAVQHPDQSGLPAGACRFVLSLRAVGEGHLSTIEFRTGVVGPGATVTLDEVGPWVGLGSVVPLQLERALFATGLAAAGADDESARFLIGELPESFARPELERAIVELSGQSLTRQGGARTAQLARELAGRSYAVTFDEELALAECALWPQSPVESRGMEDARFVRFVDDDGTEVYRATYTAFDGSTITPQLIETADFRTFSIGPLAGPAARDKGMALFPRLVGGRHVALTRADRETSGVAFSSDGRTWGEPTTVHVPAQPWELIQTGNCGSPIETSAGWLVLTHSVGPMREYAIGALLLNLDDPTTVLGSLREPLLSASADEREGYVPNVVYSCGALRFGDLLLLPYGASDDSVRFAFVELPPLVDRLLADGPPATRVNSAS
jgi:predicted GH43/DUF377 family glycosyl hydrolase